MKKALVLVCALGVVAACAGGCGDSGQTFTPEAGTVYYRYENVYRVISIDQTPTHVEGYGLHSHIPLTLNSAFSNITVTVKSYFAANSLFFEDCTKLNKEGVRVIYDYLDIASNPLLDEYYACDCTGLYSYTRKNSGATLKYTIDNFGEYPDYTLFGDVADVDIYSVSYRDLSVKDGKEVDSGSFAVIICDTPYISSFTLS